MHASGPAGPSVASFIAFHLATCDRTQREVAAEAGFEHPNVLSMIKSGETKLPLQRVGALARALRIDVRYLLRLTLREYYPETWLLVEREAFDLTLTENEKSLIKSLRHLSGEADPSLVLGRDATGRFRFL